jgi:GTP cyclohydrolase FolE2
MSKKRDCFEIVCNWLSKANFAEILDDYKIDLFTTAEQVLKVILRFALSHIQYTHNKELRQGLQYFISKSSPSSTTTNAEDYVKDLGILIMEGTDVVTETMWTPVVYKRFINLNAVMKALDK